jgi:Fe-S-cluster formation regulator IscX/YfhJ
MSIDENKELEAELEETTSRIQDVIKKRKEEILQLHDKIEELEGMNRDLEATLENLLESIKE